MAAAAAAPTPDLPAAVRSFVESSRQLAEAAGEQLDRVPASQFLSNKIEMLGGLIEMYQGLFNSCGVESRKALEEKARASDDKEAMSAIDALMDAESEWDQFITRLSARLGADSVPGPRLHTGLPCGRLQLAEARSGLLRPLYEPAGPRLLVLLRHLA
ncbi:uncharacterized protein LOC122372120 [Amphibalanus amphitrite]|nr:uncharacterized protein LOC122372120 [Amphibalanus amphitrite]